MNLTKTGYSEKYFKERTIQRGNAALTYQMTEGYDGLAQGRMRITNQKGTSVSMSLTFMFDGSSLWGFWSYEDFNWMETQMWGALKGTRGVGQRSSYAAWNDQPCLVQCAMGCETPRRVQEGTLASVPYSQCKNRCKSAPRVQAPECKPPERSGFQEAQMVLPKSCKIRSERGANSFSLSCKRLPKRLRGWRQVGKEEDRGGGHSSETTTYKRSLWTLRVERSCTKDWDNEPEDGNYGAWGDICELGQVTLSR